MYCNERQSADHTGAEEDIMSIEPEVKDNRREQQWMAESLVANLGYDKAVKACRDMCWYGTLDFLIEERDKHFAHASHKGPELTNAL
jgi:hypothetical protein